MKELNEQFLAFVVGGDGVTNLDPVIVDGTLPDSGASGGGSRKSGDNNTDKAF